MVYQGFDGPNYTQMPNQLFDECMAYLTGAEFKVLCYIARWTLGYQRVQQPISIDQMVNGFVTRSGVRLDRGAGVSEGSLKGSKSNVLRSLEERGYIIKITNKKSNGADNPSTFLLNIKADSPLAEVLRLRAGGTGGEGSATNPPQMGESATNPMGSATNPPISSDMEIKSEKETTTTTTEDLEDGCGGGDPLAREETTETYPEGYTPVPCLQLKPSYVHKKVTNKGISVVNLACQKYQDAFKRGKINSPLGLYEKLLVEAEKEIDAMDPGLPGPSPSEIAKITKKRFEEGAPTEVLNINCSFFVQRRLRAWSDYHGGATTLEKAREIFRDFGADFDRTLKRHPSGGSGDYNGTEVDYKNGKSAVA